RGEHVGALVERRLDAVGDVLLEVGSVRLCGEQQREQCNLHWLTCSDHVQHRGHRGCTDQCGCVDYGCLPAHAVALDGVLDLLDAPPHVALPPGRESDTR